MDIQRKQRLVGVMVLLALAIIFLPSLFQREQRAVVDTATLIPPKPVVEPVDLVPAPKPVAVVAAPLPEEAFQPKIIDQARSESKSEPKTKSVAPASPPSLNKDGLPNAWVVQVSSFQSTIRAKELTDKLQASGYKAYSRGVKTAKGQFYRVFIGPYVAKSRAQKAQSAVNKQYRVKSQILRFAP